MSTFDTKLDPLQFARGKTKETIQTGRRDRIERQVNVLKELSCEIDNFRRTIEGKKFATKEDVQEIEKWSDEVEAKISEADDDVLHLGKWLKNLSGKIARSSENEMWNISGHSSKLG